MELAKHVEFEYTREEVLLFRAGFQQAQLPDHLFCPEYLTSHGKFSPDKYVEGLWKNERTQKNITRVIRSDFPESFQNGSTLSPQRRNFQGGCKETKGATSTRNSKSDKRSATGTWSFSSRGFSTNGYRSENAKNTRRDSDRVEALPEWMDDGPEDEIMQLEGYGRQLESSFDKLGMSDTSKKQEEEKLVLPFSDVEFAAQFLGLAEVESKIFKEDIEEPKASRLFKFFGGRIKICISNNRNFSASSEKLPSPQESRPPTLPSQSEAVLPSVARLLSGGSKTMGSLNKLPSGIQASSFVKRQSPLIDQPVNTSSFDHQQIPSMVHPPSTVQQMQQHVSYQQQSVVNRLAESSASPAQKQKNIDLVPTSVMLQRTTGKDGVDVRAPRFSNTNSPSSFQEQEMSVSQHSSSHGSFFQQWHPEAFQARSMPEMGATNELNNYIPAFCQLGSHIFPLPNPIALAADNNYIADSLKIGDLKTASSVQSRVRAQMQVFAAVQHFRLDPSFRLVPVTDSQMFGQILKKFVEQQHQLDEEDLVECQNPFEADNGRFSPQASISLERLMSNQSTGSGGGNGANLSIINKLPKNAKLIMVEDLERQGC